MFLDQAGNNSEGLSSTELTTTIAEANGFDLSYIPENSRGELAGGQIRLLLMPVLTSFLFVISPIIVIVYQLYSQGIIKKLTSGIPIGTVTADLHKGLLISSGILLLVVLLGLYYLINTALDILGKSVLKAEGVGRKKLKTSTDSDGDTTTKLFYVINGQQFKVNKKAFLAFERGRKYRAYYTPRRKILVNIELID